ncbi:glycosyltransferase family 2 protein [Pseudarthrobacter sp902506025]|uniref:Cellulose synthase/poly-beta-1,6-N-acetylglucosamine synthase-like glycosyltransferase n=1 Tax=Pseudarthrobacter defluvii TaxID=410837 RepID=A0ABT9UN09_9MICC|nr:glycosyltransferase family 2 protein [Pseudarthrobacter defluvii]MDQ0121022.1 cellulose synthase/poly-beta-1,6-N-acetylglucosamine synthase-like glycosyltransferase [Pseudarthrobacter defluvii]
MPTALATLSAPSCTHRDLSTTTPSPRGADTAHPSSPRAGHPLRVVVLVPAYNEAGSIGATLEGLMLQSRPADLVVVIPNGCTDTTAWEARKYPVTVMELPRLEHRKSEALNRAWQQYAYDADVVVCLDADTVLPPNALAAWECEFIGRRAARLGGSSSKFTMQDPGFLSRLQKAEFATWTDTALRRRQTSVLAGTGCAINNAVLRQIASRDDREGPWVYTSQVEDFELTYRIRELGYICQVSPDVRAYTDSMKTIKALWGQRMKWQVGTVEDLLNLGINRLTLRDWGQQAMGLLGVFLKVLWIAVIVLALALHVFKIILFWWLVPVLFVALDIKRALRIPHRDWKDVLLAATFFPQELFMWLRSGWFLASWCAVLTTKITRRRIDRWEAQYTAEDI